MGWVGTRRWPRTRGAMLQQLDLHVPLPGAWPLTLPFAMAGLPPQACTPSWRLQILHRISFTCIRTACKCWQPSFSHSRAWLDQAALRSDPPQADAAAALERAPPCRTRAQGRAQLCGLQRLVGLPVYAQPVHDSPPDKVAARGDGLLHAWRITQKYVVVTTSSPDSCPLYM